MKAWNWAYRVRESFAYFEWTSAHSIKYFRLMETISDVDLPAKGAQGPHFHARILAVKRSVRAVAGRKCDEEISVSLLDLCLNQLLTARALSCSAE